MKDNLWINNSFLIATHCVFVEGKEMFGSAHLIADYLRDHGYQYTFVKHSLSDNNLLKRLRETQTNIKILQKNRTAVYIGVDPLNCFAGVVTKFLGRPGKVVYYSPDYSYERFASPVLNGIYHLLDRVCIMFADEIWCASQRILSIRQTQTKRKKVFSLPNAPRLSEINKIKSGPRKIKNLVTVYNIDHNLNLELILDSFSSLVKKDPTWKLILIGPKKNYTQKNVEEKGILPHQELIKILKESGIGLALYQGNYENNLYGDSLKIREYLACGLPVITTKVTETADLVKKNKAGILIEQSQESLLNALKHIARNYELFKKNVAKVKDNDFDVMMKNLL